MNKSRNEMEIKENKINAITVLIQDVMKIIGVEDSSDNKDTPKRVAKMYVNELFKNINNYNINELNEQMTIFPFKDIDDKFPIQINNIKFSSWCSHHLLPFMGEVDIEYVPNDVILGLSKFPRVVEYFSSKPQVQERLNYEICRYLFDLLKPKYLKVTIKAKHTCVGCRGVKSVDSEMVTKVELEEYF